MPVRKDLDAKEKLKVAYKRFMNERKPGPKNEAGKELVSAIFGTDAITAGRGRSIAMDTLR